MEESAAIELTPEQELVLEIEKQKKALQIGANWFYWIAGLSVVNSLIVAFEGEWSFIVGLGITQIVDAIAIAFLDEAGGDTPLIIKGIALVLDVMIAAGFVVFGWLANRRMGWAFVLGGALYFLDGLLFLLVQDWFSLGFHGFALFGLYGGYAALKKLREIELPLPDAPIEPPGF